jgi:hypothetical protein
MKKRILSLSLTLVMLAAFLPLMPAEMAVPTAEAALSAELRPFPQQAYFDLAVPRVMPGNRTQAQMNNDVVLQFAKIIEDFIVCPSTSDPDQFLMLLRHTSGTGGTGGAVTTSESHGYGMVMLAYLAGAEDVIISGTRTLGDALRDNLPTTLRANFAAVDRPVTVQDYFDAMFRCIKRFPTHEVEADSGNYSWGTYEWTRRSFLMVWELHSTLVAGQPTTPFRMSNRNTATDGDLDMAYALLVADRQWGRTREGQAAMPTGMTPPASGVSGYLHWGRGMIDDIFLMMSDRERAGGRSPPTSGGGSYHLWVGNWATNAMTITRTSDFMIQQFKAFIGA